MKTIIEPERKDWTRILKRPAKSFYDLEGIVKEVFSDIKLNGDEALRRYTKKFDKVDLSKIAVSKAEISNAEKKIPETLKDAINIAKNNIEKFHKSQTIEKKIIETSQGVECWQESRGIEKVGIYIPGGTAPLFSTVLMLAIPAVIAGCKEIVLCNPPDINGEINPAILYTASLIKITKLFKVGGIQAIGALTFGTESVPKVYKIFGPGNQYVTIAKQFALNKGISIDMPAGPSELLIITDKSANPVFVASDLLSQAEHGIDSQVICVANNINVLNNIEKQLNIQIEELPRKDIAREVIANSKFIYMNDMQDTIDIVNEYAPEHLILVTENNDFYIENIINAGSVFIGNYTPESAGDYASGTNHTLPTNGFAKTYSGVNLDSFTKKITFQKITKEGINNIGKTIEIMAKTEGLHAHKNAVTVRLTSENNVNYGKSITR
ncbi:MAG: histidinol dehydrogenase [Bacteroidetes bacterium]|nr:histidinol dehydrogenase [Bacteroidota bacterium]